MKKLLGAFIIAISLSQTSFATETDSLLLGKWNLFKIIENLSGDEIIPPATTDGFKFYISFQDSLVDFNLEINKCGNSYAVVGLHQIKFLYYAECTLICCDHHFSSLLDYESCTNYYVRNDNTLVLVSEERIFYFSRAVE